MASGNAIRGVRIGSGPMRPVERGEPAPRRSVTYWCADGHANPILLAADAPPPATWDCPRCGRPGGLDAANPPDPGRPEPHKSHLAYVKERRSEADGAAILAEALAALRRRRGED
ncbi:RNA polymerase-binding protein RbpA [Polymorphospora rubra]|uniref:RNA polymerase-binding protein RbpA n=1 Tax=Polymorphospora rubra TaxID=338584 RepID=UPI0033E7C3CE